MSELMHALHEHAKDVCDSNLQAFKAEHEVGKRYGDYAGFDLAFRTVRRVPKAFMARPVLFPTLSIDHVLGAIYEAVEWGRDRSTNKPIHRWTAVRDWDESDLKTLPRDWQPSSYLRRRLIFVNDRRAGSKIQCRFRHPMSDGVERRVDEKLGRKRHEWVTYHCDPYEAVTDVVKRHVSEGEIGGFEVIERVGSTLLVAHSRNHIGSAWVAVEPNDKPNPTEQLNEWIKQQ